MFNALLFLVILIFLYLRMNDTQKESTYMLLKAVA